MASWRETEYGCGYKRGGLRKAVLVAWADMEEILGHEFRGTGDEWRQVTRWLIANGAPSWANPESPDAWDENGQDGEGFYWIGPPVEGEE
jgi:hypothetical protein